MDDRLPILRGRWEHIARIDPERATEVWRDAAVPENNDEALYLRALINEYFKRGGKA